MRYFHQAPDSSGLAIALVSVPALNLQLATSVEIKKPLAKRKTDLANPPS